MMIMMRIPVLYELESCALAASSSPRPLLVMEDRSSYIITSGKKTSGHHSSADYMDFFADSVIDLGHGTWELLYNGKALPASLLGFPIGVIYDALDLGRGVLPLILSVNFTSSLGQGQLKAEGDYEQAVKQALYLLDIPTFKSYTCGTDAGGIIASLLKRERVKNVPVKAIQVREGDSNVYRLIQPARVQPSSTLADLGITREGSRVMSQGIVLPPEVRQLPMLSLYEKLRSADGWLYVVVTNL